MFQAKLACFNEMHQNVNDLVFRDSSLTLNWQSIFVASNFSVIPIRWLLTVDAEMAFSVFHRSLRCACFLLKLMRFKKSSLPNW